VSPRARGASEASGDPPSAVEITFIEARDENPARSGTAWFGPVWAALVVLALAAVVAVTIVGRGVRARGITAVEVVGTGEGHSLALDPIAAASRGPWRCLTITFAASDHAYVRAGHDGPSPCPSDQTTTILHELAGQWRVLFSSVSYRCPVALVPLVVQAELRVCPRRFAGRQASSST
jgi:hypothetical protein